MGDGAGRGCPTVAERPLPPRLLTLGTLVLFGLEPPPGLSWAAGEGSAEGFPGDPQRSLPRPAGSVPSLAGPSAPHTQGREDNEALSSPTPPARGFPAPAGRKSNMTTSRR